MTKSKHRYMADRLPPESTSYSSIFGRILEITWLAVIFLIPIYINPFSHLAFHLSKVLLFQFAVIFMLAMAVADWIYTRSIPERFRFGNISKSALHIAILIFGLLSIVSTIISITPHTSFWGSYFRNDGLLTLICLILFFLIISSYIRSRTQVIKVIYSLLISSGIVSIIGILQSFFSNILVVYISSKRVFSTIGNPLAVSVFLAIVIPFTMAMIFFRWKYSSKGKNNWISLALIVLLALQLWCLYLAQYSITILLYLISPILFLTLWGFIHRNRIVSGIFALALIIILTAGTMVIMRSASSGMQGGVSTGNGDVPSSGITQTQFTTVTNRIAHWQGTIKMMIDSSKSPLIGDGLSFLRIPFGYGPETFPDTYQGYYPDNLKSSFMYNLSINDRPHNHYLYLAATVGILGLIAFLSMLVTFFYLSYRYIRRSTIGFDKLVIIALISGVVAYMSDSFFNPNSILAQYPLWLMFGLLSSMSVIIFSTDKDSEEEKISKKLQEKSIPGIKASTNRRFLSIGAAVLFVALGIGITIKPFLADIQIQKGLNLYAMRGENVIDAFEKAVELVPGEANYWQYLGWFGYVKALDVGQTPARTKYLTISADAYEKAKELEKYNVINYLLLADIYVFWGSEGSSDKYPLAFSLYDQAEQLSNGNAVILNKWAIGLISKGDLDSAKAMLDKSVEMDPKWGQTTFVYSLLYAEKKDDIKVNEYLIKPVQNSPGMLSYFTDLCLNLTAYRLVDPFETELKSQISKNPDNWVSHAMLGIADMCIGDYDKAHQEYDAAMEIVLDPDIQNLIDNEFIKLSRLALQ